jgi:hypothetical protein
MDSILLFVLVGVVLILFVRYSHAKNTSIVNADLVSATSLFNDGGLTVNSNGTSDVITITSIRPTGSELWTLGLGPVTLSLNAATGKFVTDDGFTFPTVVTTGTAYKREIVYSGGQLLYKINGVTHSRPAAAPNLAPIGARSGVEWTGVAGSTKYAVSVSNFGHTKNIGATYHLYDGTPDTTKRVAIGATTVNMVTNQKGAGYTAS